MIFSLVRATSVSSRQGFDASRTLRPHSTAISHTSVELPGLSACSHMRPWAAGSSRSTYVKSPVAPSAASTSSSTRSTNISSRIPKIAPGCCRSTTASGSITTPPGAQSQLVIDQHRRQSPDRAHPRRCTSRRTRSGRCPIPPGYRVAGSKMRAGEGPADGQPSPPLHPRPCAIVPRTIHADREESAREGNLRLGALLQRTRPQGR